MKAITITPVGQCIKTSCRGINNNLMQEQLHAEKLHMQALSLGYAVKMQGTQPGRTPAVITPPVITPAATGEPGATPINDATPQVPTKLLPS